MKKCILILGCIFCFLQTSTAQQNLADEADIKAYFIHSFTNYIEWPESDNKKFTIGIIGDNAIAISLVKIAKYTTVNEKELEIRLWHKTEEISDCNILFIDDSMEKFLKEIFEKIADKNILSVGDKKDFGKKGVAVNFIRKNDKVKFEINRKAIAKTNLKISSQLLKLATFTEEND